MTEYEDKQIEEMAKHCFFFEGGYCCVDIYKSVMCENEKPACAIYQTLENLYKAGYRKQSDVAREIFEEIDNIIYNLRDSPFYSSGDAVYELTELKKKYTEVKRK